MGFVCTRFRRGRGWDQEWHEADEYPCDQWWDTYYSEEQVVFAIAMPEHLREICYEKRDKNQCTRPNCPYDHDPNRIAEARRLVNRDRRKGNQKGKGGGKKGSPKGDGRERERPKGNGKGFGGGASADRGAHPLPGANAPRNRGHDLEIPRKTLSGPRMPSGEAEDMCPR